MILNYFALKTPLLQKIAHVTYEGVMKTVFSVKFKEFFTIIANHHLHRL